MKESASGSIDSSKNADRYDISLILKCTRRCNLACDYCTSHRSGPNTDFGLELLSNIFYHISTDPGIQTPRFIWHGGEPLVLGIDFFKKVLFLQNRLLTDKKVCNVLQTNATLLTHEWASYLKEHNFNIGVSLDGPPEVHNKHRRLATGGDTFTAAMRGIKILKEHNFQFGILTVVTPDLIDLGPHALFDFYRKEDIKNFGLLSLRHTNASLDEFVLYKQQYEKFMTSFLRLWLEVDDTSWRLREFESKLDAFFGLPHRLCKDGGPCVGNFFGIEPDGSISHCDKFTNDSRFVLGNVLEHSFEDIRKSEKLSELKKLEREIRQQCGKCRWFHLCGGGCLFDSISLLNAGSTLVNNECLEFALYEELSKILSRSKPVLEAIKEEIER